MLKVYVSMSETEANLKPSTHLAHQYGRRNFLGFFATTVEHPSETQMVGDQKSSCSQLYCSTRKHRTNRNLLCQYSLFIVHLKAQALPLWILHQVSFLRYGFTKNYGGWCPSIFRSFPCICVMWRAVRSKLWLRKYKYRREKGN